MLLPLAATAIANDKTMLVLDASGSMWGQLEGYNKIDIAKDALKKLTQGWAGKEVGLIAYGHREKGSCSDIETLMPVDRLDVAKMHKVVDGISPKGKTPLSAAVRQAAEALKYTEDKSTVILISDGIETCDLDPCKVGSELEKLGVDFTAHVIGFDVKQEQQQGLRCLADNTGGSFIAAKNAVELNQALDKVTKQPAPIPKASLDAPDKAEKTATVTVTPKAAKTGLTGFIHVYPKGSDDYIASLSRQVDEEHSPVKLALPAKTGSYVLKWLSKNGDKLAEKTIEVTETQIGIIAPESAKRASRVTLKLKAPQALEGYLRMFPKTGGDHVLEQRVGDATEVSLLMPVKTGNYEIRWVNQNNTDEVYARQAITLTEATLALKTVDSAKKGATIHVNFDAPANLEGYVYVHAEGNGEYESENFVGMDGFSDGIEITLPEKTGTFLLKWQSAEGVVYAEKTIQVTE